MEYRLAKRGELKECGEIAGKSFENYVFYKMFPMDERHRVRFIHEVMRTGVCCAFARNELLVGLQDGHIVAVAIVEAPGHRPPSTLEYLLRGGIGVLLAAGKKNTHDWMRMLKECDSAIDGLKQPHWHLSSLTIAEGHKGQGLGSTMIQQGIVGWIRKNGGGLLTLITNSDGNRRFYERNGFEAFDHCVVERNDTSMDNWSFRMSV